MIKAAVVGIGVSLGCVILWSTATLSDALWGHGGVTAAGVVMTAMLIGLSSRRLRRLAYEAVYLAGLLIMTRGDRTHDGAEPAGRAATIAPILEKALGTKNAPYMTICAIGSEYQPDDTGTCRWTELLKSAAAQGAKTSVLIPSGDDPRQYADLWKAGQDDDNLKCVLLPRGIGRTNALVRIVCAWSSDPARCDDTVLWIERRNGGRTIRTRLIKWNDNDGDDQSIFEACVKNFIDQGVKAHEYIQREIEQMERKGDL